MTERKEIQIGTVVRYTGDNENIIKGWYSVTRVTKNTVNIGAIFGRTIYAKGIPKADVVEDHNAWYEAWQNTDAYRQM